MSTLDDLIHRLERLVEILSLDSKCSWTAKFEADLSFARQLRQMGFSKADLTNLSASIMAPFKGSGSFNDYSPAAFDAQTGKYTPLPETQDFESVSNEVYELALQLRMPGSGEQ